MAVPSYTTDLVDLDTGEGLHGWVEATVTNWDKGSVPVTGETDYFIQGSYCVSEAVKAGFNSAVFNYGSSVTIPSSGAVLSWLYFGAPNNISSVANSGMSVVMGNAQNALYGWTVFGSDTYQYGGWRCIPVDPTTTPNVTGGSPTSTRQWFGSLANVLATLKGSPMGVDAVRYGRCEARMSGGEAANYCTFSGFAATNDASGARWGLIQSIAGGYQWQGRMGLGISGVVDFRDSNVNLVVADTQKVSPNFNLISIANTGSHIDWDTISIAALGTTSRGKFLMQDNCSADFTSCTFTDMGAFSFQPSATISYTTFRRCQQVTQGGATFSNCTFAAPYATVALCSDSPGLISYCSFTSSGGGHAMEWTTPGEYNFDGNTFAGYGSAETVCAAIYNNSGGAITANIGGGGDGAPTVRNGTGASTTICAGLTTLTLTNIISGSEVRIYDQAGPPPNELAGIEATVTPTETTFQYSYIYSPDTNVDIVVFKNDYLYYRIEDYTLGSSNSSLPIAQQIDRQYSNPT